ncbi:hypothetical protein K2173_013695 [Erythroxylum novogranatense]|uniref:Receptor-like serine/threonine-protein kinase n=1 Tax=Erythroxylum novogranatense TaxID=1862640 RepID=A0AAV8SAM1_9ROSI|nr:hypothetical protein K2173_013695 [Erythroxylum novogranatense]
MAYKARKFVSYAALLLLLCIFSYCVSEASTTDTLNPGDRLNSSGHLVSRNELFELRFDGNFLGIWFSGIYSSSHPVWLANRNPTFANYTGVLTLDASGNLRIVHTNGDLIQTIYPGNESATNATAVLLESGNFVLKETNSKQILWQSFDHSTDTLLPGMKLGINYKTREKLSLTSWLRADNASPGAFTMEWGPNEEQLIVKRRGRRFWSSGKRYENIALLGYLNSNYNITKHSNADESYVSYSLLVDEFTPEDRRKVSRWLLDYDGNIHDLESTGRPYYDYSRLCDWNSTETGCAKWEGPECRRDDDKFRKRITNTRLGMDSYYNDTFKNLSFADCKELCWKDCNCSGVGMNSGFGYGCNFYHGPFNYDDLTGDEQIFYVIIPGPPPDHKANMTGVWIAIAVSTTVIMALMGIFLYLRWKRLRLEEKFLKELMTSDRPSDANELENGGNRNNLQVYSAAEIKTATNAFSLANKLGEGGFGPVYKGKFAQGQEIAVKKLSRRSGQGLVEFKNELILIAKLQHSNLVRLLGFCVQGEEKMLVYEYLPNKSLDFFIFGDQSKRELLDWNKRFSIIEGIAQGLLYLHKYSRLRIIHRDLKASNILLDKDMNPKISDFGLARIFKPDEPEANTIRVVGTYGYMPLEYAMEGIFSVKSDVYSFGVLVLEVVSGKKNHSIYDFDRMLNLVDYAWELWKVDPLKLVDLAIMESAVKDQVLKCINVSLLCVEPQSMRCTNHVDVLSMLASDVNQLPSPKQPAFYNVERNSVIENSTKEQTQVNCSANQMSLTEMVGR